MCVCECVFARARAYLLKTDDKLQLCPASWFCTRGYCTRYYSIIIESVLITIFIVLYVFYFYVQDIGQDIPQYIPERDIVVL